MAKFIGVYQILNKKDGASDKPLYINTDLIIEFKENEEDSKYYKTPVTSLVVLRGNGTFTYTIAGNPEAIIEQINKP